MRVRGNTDDGHVRDNDGNVTQFIDELAGKRRRQALAILG